MKYFRFFVFMLLLGTASLFAIVGDWVSFGSQLSIKDLHVSGKMLRAASHGGIVIFDTQKEEFSTESNTDQLEHIDILRYFVNSDGSEWYSYASGLDGISYRTARGISDYFDFDFFNASAFTGNDDNVLAIYMNDFTPEVVHFAKNNNYYIFQDIYNQFPGDPASIFDISIVGDSLFLATDKGLIKSWLYNANLKPKSAWMSISLDSSQTPICLGVKGDSLYYVNEDNDLYLYFNGTETKLFEGDEPPLSFSRKGDKLFYATSHKIYDLSDGSVQYTTDRTLSGFTYQGDTLWVAKEEKGLSRIISSSVSESEFIPNTMLYMRANSLAMTEDKRVAVCGLSGISILDGKTWHNLVFSPYEEAIHEERFSDRFSADTLNIAYLVGGQTTIYDAMVSSSGELFCTTTDVSVIPYTNQPASTQGPGALLQVDLDDLTSYTVYDTSNNVIDGTQGVGGSSYYLKMHGLAEDKYGNIWALNVHTLAAETLLKFKPNGDIQKYSKEESNNTLQILAREMVFDRYGRLWIANEARQSDEPRTTGGITVFDQSTGVWNLITTSDGLISNNVYSIDQDPLTGNMWVATAAGVQMIYTPSSFTASTEFNMSPSIDGLSGIVPVKLRIDPKGNKWILTQSQGVQIYMTNNRWFADGSGLTTDNSSLLDNVVYDLVFDTEKGYAYLLTASGLNRYEIAWIEERSNMDNVIIFPQPFKPGVDPYITIDGIAEQSQVRISTIGGRVLHVFDSDAIENMGKQIVWDGILGNGEYISRGVYLVFISNIDGLKATAKFAVE
jgi:hypothetical protein